MLLSDKTVVFNASAFAARAQDTHSLIFRASRYQVAVLGSHFAAPVVDTGWDLAHPLLWTSPAGVCEVNGRYEARVGFQDDLLQEVWSEPLDVTKFFLSTCNSGFRVTFFAEDDITPVLGLVDVDGAVLEGSFSTGITCARPYLKMPSAFSDAEVDFPNGKSVIGAVNIEVVDKRIDPADQQTGIVTSILDQLLGARALLEQWVLGVGWVVRQDGLVYDMSFDERLVTYKFTVRDVRERERVPLFMRSLSVVWPEFGPRDDYGTSLGHPPLLAAAAVYTGTFVRHVSLLGGTMPCGSVAVPDKTYQTATAEEYGMPQLFAGESILDGALAHTHFPDAVVRWRPVGGTNVDWVYLADMVADEFGIGNVFSAFTFPITFLSGPMLPACAIYLSAADEADLPGDGASIELQVLSGKTPTEEAPLYFEGPFGRLLKDIYDGVYTSSPMRMRYDAAAMDDFVLSSPTARMRITASEPDARTWVEENIYAPNGYAPVFNQKCEVAPISWVLPDSTQDLPVLDDSVVAPGGASWKLGTENAVTSVEFQYVRESMVDGQLQERTVIVDHESTSRLPDKPLTYKPQTVRALGTVDGKPLTNDITAETGARLAQGRALDVLERFKNGAPQIVCRARASDVAVKDCRPGQWRRVALSWMPDLRTKKRGLNHAMQIVSVKVNSSGWTDLTLIDGTDEATLPVSVPPCSVDAPVIDASGNLSVTVVLVPISDVCRLDYAVSEVEPDATSGLWTLWAKTDAPTTIASAPPPNGAAIWIRYRTEVPGTRPGPWATAGSVGDSLMPGVSGLAITTVIVGSNGTATVHWTPNAACEGLRIMWGIANQSEESPQFTNTNDVSASAGSWVIPATADLTTPKLVGVMIMPFRRYASGVCTGTPGVWDMTHVNF